MRLPKDLEQCVVYFFPDAKAARAGDSRGGASGFFLAGETPGGYVPMIITNRHVIESGSTTMRFLGETGRPITVESTEKDWFFSQDNNVDLAFLTLPPRDYGIKAVLIPSSTILSGPDVPGLELRLGDDCAMLGRHLNYDGRLTNTPTARFGHLVQFATEKVRDDRGRHFEAFLVQMPSLPGFSGSPVFLIQDEIAKGHEKGRMAFNPPSTGRRTFLLGVNVGHIPAYAPTYQADTNIRNQYLDAEINSGIITVIPWWTVFASMQEYARAVPPSMIVGEVVKTI